MSASVVIAQTAEPGAATPGGATAPTASSSASPGPLTAEQVGAQVAGKKFYIQTPNGSTANVEYGTNGVYYARVMGLGASGKWAAEPGRLCTEMFGKKECRDVRLLGDELQLFRSDNQWVRMMPQ
jgi:hypothetical protein